MITRRFQKGDAESEALYSDCETYRYALTRVWDVESPRLLYIMLNPSKATEVQNDATIERCERRARALGFGGFRAVNIFALRETHPHKMRKHPAPEGPDNQRILQASCDWADTILAAWGVHGAHLEQGPNTHQVLATAGYTLSHFGLTKEGHPRHPLYVPYAQQPELWR
ncbi:MAG: DUF1643 domain-containing protein [Cognatishimia sp.]|uniref:DUF1643 domain-containing protein n=1 Tax=Cognatishimia sp. TaxID=2211648 RepID=UPI003B8B1D49